MNRVVCISILAIAAHAAALSQPRVKLTRQDLNACNSEFAIYQETLVNDFRKNAAEVCGADPKSSLCASAKNYERESPLSEFINNNFLGWYNSTTLPLETLISGAQVRVDGPTRGEHYPQGTVTTTSGSSWASGADTTPSMKCAAKVWLDKIAGAKANSRSPGTSSSTTKDGAAVQATSCLNMRNLPLPRDDPWFNSKVRYEVRNTCGYPVIAYIYGKSKSGFPAKPTWTDGARRELNPELAPGDPGPRKLGWDPEYMAGPDWDAPILPAKSTHVVELSGGESPRGVAFEHTYSAFHCQMKIQAEGGFALQRLFHTGYGEKAMCYPILRSTVR